MAKTGRLTGDGKLRLSRHGFARTSPGGTSGASRFESRSTRFTLARMTVGLASARSARSVQESGAGAKLPGKGVCAAAGTAAVA